MVLNSLDLFNLYYEIFQAISLTQKNIANTTVPIIHWHFVLASLQERKLMWIQLHNYSILLPSLPQTYPILQVTTVLELEFIITTVFFIQLLHIGIHNNTALFYMLHKWVHI